MCTRQFSESHSRFTELHTTQFTFSLDLEIDISGLRAIASEILAAIPETTIQTGDIKPDKDALVALTSIVCYLFLQCA